MIKRLLIMVSLLAPLAVTAQVKVVQDQPKGLPGKITDRKVTSVEPVLDPETVVSFEPARLADMDGKRVTVPLKGKITIVEYWSRGANDSNKYWNRMRDLEQKYADRDDVQIISINYDTALGGEAQRSAVREYFKNYTAPRTVYVDLDDGIREIFSLNGPVAYMLFNQHEQYIYTGRGDAPETEKLFAEIDRALVDKEKWDAYVKKTLDAHNNPSN